MAIRETLNKNPVIALIAIIVIIVVMLSVIIWEVRKPRPNRYLGNMAYFTDDDGSTWFPADLSNIPPFIDKNGLPAVHCYVFQCGKTTFVGYLEKFTDEAKKKLSDAGQIPRSMAMPNAILNAGGRLLKKKGGADWVELNPSNTNLQAAQKVADIIQVKCPDGSSDTPTPVNP